MKRIRLGLCVALLFAALALLPSFALANPVGVVGMLAANGTAITVADPSSDVSNEAANPKDTQSAMWRHEATLQGIVNKSGGSHALVYWQTGTQSGQPVYTYLYLSETDLLFGGGVKDCKGDASITQTGGKLGAIMGGGYNGDLDGDVSIAISGGQCGIVVGGGMADVNGSDSYHAHITGKVDITASGGLIGVMFGGGAAVSRETASAAAEANVVHGVNITLKDDVKIVYGAALGGFAESFGDADARSSVEGVSALNINLPEGAPGQYALNFDPNSLIAVIGGSGASNPEGSGSASASMTEGRVNLNSGTIFGLAAGGGAAMNESGKGRANTITTNASVSQTGGFVLPANGQGGAIISGGVTALPMTGGQPDIGQAQYAVENVMASSLHISGGMAGNALANGVVLGQRGTYSYIPTDFIRTYDSDGSSIVTGGSVKNTAGRVDTRSKLPGLHRVVNNPDLKIINPTLANKTTPVYRTAMLIHQRCGSSLAACTPLKNKPVSALRGVASYGMKDVYTDDASAPKEAGGVYAWLPAGSKVAGAISGGVSYPYQPKHPSSDAHYSDTTAKDNLTWMALSSAAPPAPPTGDGEGSLLWFMLLLLSALGCGACLCWHAGKRRRS